MGDAFVAKPDARRYCAQVRDDDTIRQLPRSLVAEIMGGKPTSDEIDFFVSEHTSGA